MFCQKCGNVINEDARFCPKCGTEIEITVPETGDEGQDSVNDAKGVLSLIVAKIKSIYSTIILIFIVFIILLHKGCLSPVMNNNQGAETPEEVAVAVANYYKYGDFSYLNNYFDKQINNEEIEAEFKKQRESLELDTSNINMDTLNPVVTEMGDYSKGLKKCIATIHVQSGFGIMENSYSNRIHLHQAKTAQGVKWFLGQ